MGKFKTVGNLTVGLEEVLFTPEKKVFEALEAGIAPVIDSIKDKGRELGVVDTGQTINSLKAGKPKFSNNDQTYKIGASFEGYRKKNREGKKMRNAEVAYINEFGNGRKGARPFVREGTVAAADEAAKVIADKLYGGKK